MTEVDIYDIIGLIGVALSLGCYMRVQWKRDYAKHMSYSVGNFFGSSFIAISLLHKWNMASFIGNAIWAGISLYGIYRCLKYAKQQRITAKSFD